MPGRNVSNERGQRNVSNDRGKRNVSNDRGKRNAAGKVRSHQPRSAGKSGKNIWEFENDWATGLGDCCHRPKVCCYAFWCLPCYMSTLYKRTGECCLSSCCVPFSLVAMRSKLRTGFRINGGICGDCVAVACCTSCVAIQLNRELEFHGL